MTSKPGSKDKADEIELIDLYQKREKIYVRAVKGRFRNLRIIGGALLLLLYFGTAWLNVNGQQIILFDLPQRQFHLFGTTFWPQDLSLLSLLLITCAYGLFFITNFAGRVWCGYACPQSVFTWLFLWVEKITEGDRRHRIRLDQAANSTNKCLRKLTKHLLWLALSLATALTFVGYFTPIRTLIPELLQLQVGGWALFWIGFFTLATYANAGWLREQVCIYMCPYARFQSVMFDSDTLSPAYDTARGEPRGARKKEPASGAEKTGDCIDCHWCVQVCPTGIDIRDGLQYECVGCAACIDACDQIMDKMETPRGLIRYTTEHNLNGKKTRLLRPRLIGYFAALVAIILLIAVQLNQRIPLTMEVLRDRSALFNRSSDGLIENVYTLKIANMDRQSHRYQLKVSGLPGISLRSAPELNISSGEVRALPVRLAISEEQAPRLSSQVYFELVSLDDAELKIRTEARFIGPTH